MEKTFVDYFLLEDHENIKKWINVENLRNLNALEQVLMILYLKLNNQFV